MKRTIVYDCNEIKIDVLSRYVLIDVLNSPPPTFRDALDLALIRNPPCSRARYAAMVRSAMNAISANKINEPP